MRLNEREINTTLRQNGYKITPQRRAVIRKIASSRDHLTPAAIYNKVRRDHPSIGLVTVYRTLEMLGRLGLVCELHAGGSCRSYTVSAADSHDHLICSECGEVIDFSQYDLGELEQKLSRETSFAIESHLLEFTGRCKNCQQRAA